MIEKEVAASAAAAAATLSSIMLSFFGVDHRSLFYGFVGAFFTYALSETAAHSRTKSVIFVLASAFTGGVFGVAFGDGVQPATSMTLFLCIVGGSGATVILTAAASKSAAVEMVKRILGGAK